MGKYSNLKIGETIKTTNGRLYGPLMIDGKKVFRFQGMASQKGGKTTKQSTKQSTKKVTSKKTSQNKGGKSAKKTVKTSKIIRTKKQTGGSSIEKGGHSEEATGGSSKQRPVSLKTAVQLLRQYYREKYP